LGVGIAGPHRRGREWLNKSDERDASLADELDGRDNDLSGPGS